MGIPSDFGGEGDARFDLFTAIHKALRAMIYETGGALQTADFADEQAARRAVEALRPALAQMQHHHDLEEEHVFPMVRPFEEEMIRDLQAQHDQVERLLGVTGIAADEATSAAGGARVGAGNDLNRRFNELIALFLEHLAHEEATLLPATWKHFDDAQLVAVQGAIIAAQQPEDLMQSLRWMFKGLNRPELVGLLSGAKATMPAPALDAVRQLGASSMEPAAWAVVREEAGL